VSEAACRLVNAVASASAGRAYVSRAHGLVAALLWVLRGEAGDTAARQNALGALQKCSLRRSAQRAMTDAGAVEWAAAALGGHARWRAARQQMRAAHSASFVGGAAGRSSPSLSQAQEAETRAARFRLAPYSVEYAAALLMNLCLRPEGRRRAAAMGDEARRRAADAPPSAEAAAATALHSDGDGQAATGGSGAPKAPPDLAATEPVLQMFKLALQVGLLGTPPGGQPSLPQAGIEEAEQDAEDDEAADQVRTYLNGALYSLLTLPAILDRARACGLEAAVSGAQTASGEVQRRHLGFILRQLRTSSSASQSASGEAAHLVGGRDGLGSGRAAPEDGTQAGSPGRPFAGTIASGAGAERGAGSEGHRTSGHNGDAGHGEGDDVGGVDGNDDDDGHDDDDDEDDDEDDDGELDASEGGAIDADNMDEDEDGDAADVLVAVHAEGEAAGEELLGRLYTQAAVHRRNAAREAAESSGAAEGAPPQRPLTPGQGRVLAMPDSGRTPQTLEDLPPELQPRPKLLRTPPGMQRSRLLSAIAESGMSHGSMLDATRRQPSAADRAAGTGGVPARASTLSSSGGFVSDWRQPPAGLSPGDSGLALLPRRIPGHSLGKERESDDEASDGEGSVARDGGPTNAGPGLPDWPAEGRIAVGHDTGEVEAVSSHRIRASHTSGPDGTSDWSRVPARSGHLLADDVLDEPGLAPVGLLPPDTPNTLPIGGIISGNTAGGDSDWEDDGNREAVGFSTPRRSAEANALGGSDVAMAPTRQTPAVDRVLPGTDCAALDRPPASEVPDVAPADEVFAARPRILRSPKGRA